MATINSEQLVFGKNMLHTADVYLNKQRVNSTIFMHRGSYTLVFISNEIYETSLGRVLSILDEMITSVRFSLSYDPLKWDLNAFTLNIISKGKRIVDMEVVNDVTCTGSTRQSVITRVVIRFL